MSQKIQGNMSVTAETDLSVEDQIVIEIKKVYDPEIPVNVYDLGLIYNIEVESSGAVEIKMTLTAPGCPVAGMLLSQVEQAASSVPGITTVGVELVWDPPWTQDRITDEAKLELGIL